MKRSTEEQGEGAETASFSWCLCSVPKNLGLKKSWIKKCQAIAGQLPGISVLFRERVTVLVFD